jgi:threonine/homoserine/homoserine lactone efflux protein
MILDPQLYALFLTAALVLTLAPGPDTMFVLGAGLGGGARGGLPKVAIFYVAFLPQFVSPELGHTPLQLLLLGLTHWLIGLPYLCAVALASGSTAAWLRSSPGIRRALDALSGLVFVGLALRLMLVKRKPA